MLEIDGAYGEGGGQLLRTAVALSAITHQAVRIVNIRAGRSRPGLAAQHIAAVRAVAALCDARVFNLVPHAAQIEFRPGAIRGGLFRFDVGTAGSVTLVLQALMPVAVAGGVSCRAVITGGTDVRGAPPADYVRMVTLPLLRRMRVEASLDVTRRGYYPKGGGEVELALAPSVLRPVLWTHPDSERRIAGHAHVACLPVQIAERMRAAAQLRLAAHNLSASIEIAGLDERQAYGPGGAVVLWAKGEAGTLGAARVAERGVRAEALGEAVAEELAADIVSGAALDTHAADQMLVYLALAAGESGFTARELTRHARTAMWLIERFLPTRFEIAEEMGMVRVCCRGCGIRTALAARPT
jgi:RNA 3'-terminal phosphate cyclase (ATP)